MPIQITMPALSPTMEEGTLAKWLVKEGDKVSAGDVLAEIETDKATMEVESIDDGVVAKLLVAAGSEGVKVNRVIAILALEGEDVAEVAEAGDAPASPVPVPASAPNQALPVRGEVVIAIDLIGAGMDEIVLIARGSAARIAAGTGQIPTDAAIIAIVDSVQCDGQSTFVKH